MTLWRHLRKEALQLLRKCRFWKGDPDFTLVFKKPSGYRAPFPINSTFNGSRIWRHGAFSAMGAASDSWIQILRGWPGLYLVFNSNITSTVPRFRYHWVLFFSPKWRHNVNSARRCCKLSVYANSGRATPTLYLYSMVTKHLSYTLSDIIRFHCWPYNRC